MGRLLKNLWLLWYFYFATYVQFLVGSLTKQVADMERVFHIITSQCINDIEEKKKIPRGPNYFLSTIFGKERIALTKTKEEQEVQG